MKRSASVIGLTVNGMRHELAVEPRRLLVDCLRDDLGLTGTHIGCEHGVCGTCTVLVNDETVRSCLMLAVQADGATITTVEGLATDGTLHPLQQAFREAQGLQCGFCTPGMLMLAWELLRDHPAPSEAEIREALSANLCRCTGYQSIVEAVQLAAERRAVAGGIPAATAR
jgi:aerobic carbon-monoxide dehydrogenase small subunit